MKKFTKIFLGIAAAMTVALSFTSCAAILDVMLSKPLDLVVVSDAADFNDAKIDVKVYENFFKWKAKDYVKGKCLIDETELAVGDRINMADAGLKGGKCYLIEASYSEGYLPKGYTAEDIDTEKVTEYKSSSENPTNYLIISGKSYLNLHLLDEGDKAVIRYEMQISDDAFEGKFE